MQAQHGWDLRFIQPPAITELADYESNTTKTLQAYTHDEKLDDLMN